MALVLLIVYGVPFYNIGFFFIKFEVLATRDGQGRIFSIFIDEANNVNKK
jgi:hypothetical protein